MSSQFQMLSNEFNILISKYQDTYKKYIHLINSGKNNLKIVDDSIFLGREKINIFNNTNISNCRSFCLSNKLCSGATFDTLSNKCTLSSGSGNIIPAQKSKAIIKEAMYYSYELHNLNNKLIDINKKMMDNYNNQKYQTNKASAQQLDKIIKTNYQTLNEDQDKIKDMIIEFETLNKSYENGNTIVTSNYYSYVILLILVIVLIILLLNFSFTSKQTGGSIMLLKINIYNIVSYFLILLLVIFIYYGYNL